MDAGIASIAVVILVIVIATKHAFVKSNISRLDTASLKS